MRPKRTALILWLVFFLLLVLPLYAISVSFAIRSGLFNLRGRSISSDEYKALWAFIAAGLGTSATIVGLIFTRAHNQRTADQLALDTAVKTLELLTIGEKKCVPSKNRWCASSACSPRASHHCNEDTCRSVG